MISKKYQYKINRDALVRKRHPRALEVHKIKCARCGQEYGIGDFPYCPHGKVMEHHPFVPYFDEHIKPGGAWINSHHDRVRINKEQNQDFAGKKIGMPGCEV